MTGSSAGTGQPIPPPLDAHRQADAEDSFQASPIHRSRSRLNPMKKVFADTCMKYVVIGDVSKFVDEGARTRLKSIGGEEIAFKTQDGFRLEGMYFAPNPAEKPTGKTVLICSGSHQSFETYTEQMIKTLKKEGNNVMVFNYRGFGNSEGKATEQGIYDDAEAAFQYLTEVKNVAEDDLTVLGFSLGGAPAADLGTHHRINVILDRTFSSASSMAKQEAPTGLGAVAKEVFKYGGGRLPVKKKLKDIKGNVLWIRSTSPEASMTSERKFNAIKKILDTRQGNQIINDELGPHDAQNSPKAWYNNREFTPIVSAFISPRARGA